MNDFGKFVADFIQDSVSGGCAKPSDIRGLAKQKIGDLNEEIAKIDELKTELKTKKTKLYAVIKHLGGGSKTNIINQSFDWSLSFQKLNPFFREIITFICSEISEHGGISNKDLLKKFGIENNKSIFSSIKWLGARDIIERDEDMILRCGKKWEDLDKCLS